jgi:hypothetical protein
MSVRLRATTEIPDCLSRAVDPWHFMMRAFVAHPRNPHAPATTEFPNIEFASSAESVCCVMESDVFGARVGARQEVDEEESWVVVERFQKLELQSAVPLANAPELSNTMTISEANSLVHFTFPFPPYL